MHLSTGHRCVLQEVQSTLPSFIFPAVWTFLAGFFPSTQFSCGHPFSDPPTFLGLNSSRTQISQRQVLPTPILPAQFSQSVRHSREPTSGGKRFSPMPS